MCVYVRFTIHTNEMLALLFHLVRLGVVYAKYDLLAELFKAFFSAPAQAHLGSDKSEHQVDQTQGHSLSKHA